MATGTVKWVTAKKAVGFHPADDGGKDVFVHISAVERAGMHGLQRGQKVSYEVIADRQDWQVLGPKSRRFLSLRRMFIALRLRMCWQANSLASDRQNARLLAWSGILASGAEFLGGIRRAHMAEQESQHTQRQQAFP